jgi:hypothetical protein
MALSVRRRELLLLVVLLLMIVMVWVLAHSIELKNVDGERPDLSKHSSDM